VQDAYVGDASLFSNCRDKQEVEEFYFEYWSEVDRGRVVVPARCRRQFQLGLLLVLGEKGRFIAAEACPGSQPKLDARGRLYIPRKLRNEANIADAAVTVGSGGYIEIWNPQSWKEEKAIVEAEALGWDMWVLATMTEERAQLRANTRPFWGVGWLPPVGE
jgi:DNA-binding transcriptional regulator/RsmH inhibitor MraZ